MENTIDRVIIPEEEINISFEVTADKPFNQCFECRSFRNGCSGPNLFAMGIERACEFLQMARIHQGFSYQTVADATTISLAQVKRIFTGKVSDPSFFSMKALSDFLLGDPQGKSPCAIPDIAPAHSSGADLVKASIEMERLISDNEAYVKALDEIHASYKQELDALRIDHKTEMDATVQHYEREHEAQQVHIQRQRLIIDHLTDENSRKSRMIDKFVDSHFSSVPKE
ncbi:MAG: helix-turn-helix transcriptional regulator [Oscillospiraceae bacterium]|nr:helix-turn-helix transcriptional regulator [Oscillospiraceae bacterium]